MFSARASRVRGVRGLVPQELSVGLVQLWKEIMEEGIIKAGAQKLNDSGLNFKSRT